MTGTLHWFKSSYSNDSGGDCVEVAHHAPADAPTTIHVRDSKHPTTPHLTLTTPTWTAFIEWAK